MITLILPDWFVSCLTVIMWLYIIAKVLNLYIVWLKAKWVKDYGKEYPEYDITLPSEHVNENNYNHKFENMNPAQINLVRNFIIEMDRLK